VTYDIRKTTVVIGPQKTKKNTIIIEL